MEVSLNPRKSRGVPLSSSQRTLDLAAMLGCWLLLALLAVHMPPGFWFFLDDAFLFTSLFAGLAWMMRAVSLTGALAGFALSLILYAAEGPMMFAALVVVFLLTWGATRYRRARKPHLSAGESGGRTASQIAANIGPAALVAVAAVLGFGLEWLSPLIALAVLAEVAADTVSSEYGQAVSDQAYLVTTGERVPAGTQGAVSRAGTIAGMSAAFAVCATWQIASQLYLPPDVVNLPGSLIRSFGEFFQLAPVLLVLFGAVVGMTLDSFLGATLERKGIIGNNLVNLFSTTSAAVTVLGVHALLDALAG